MITYDKLAKLNRYSTSSWAIWDEPRTHTKEFFEKNIARLKNNVVFLGLNRSGAQREAFGNFQNFHAPEHRGDAELKKLIQGQNLENLTGGYMTDLSEVFESDSRKLEIDPIASGKRLEEQLEILGCENFTVVCFGGDAFKSLVSFYDAEKEIRHGMEFANVNRSYNLSIFKVFHYSLNGFNNKNVKEKLPGQLTTINRAFR